MKLRPTRGSGCGLVEKGDLYSPLIHVEVKTTRRQQVQIHEWWSKAVDQAREHKRRQVVLMVLTEPKAYKLFSAWVVLPLNFYDFLRVRRVLHRTVRNSGHAAIHFPREETLAGPRGLALRHDPQFHCAKTPHLVQGAVLQDASAPGRIHYVALMPRLALPTGPELEQLLQDPRCPTI